MENTEENRKKTRKIQNKSKLKSDKIWKIGKKPKLNIEIIWKNMEERHVE
jgi:hypothetical protein